VHYHFTSKERFEREIAEGKFLEYAYVHDNIYGTSIAAVQAVAAAGRCCILDIDVQGARQVRTAGLRAVFVFVAPPSLEELERRLRGRGTESEAQVTTRLKTARDELASMEEAGLYDAVVINADLDACARDLGAVAARALAGEVGPAQSSSARHPGGGGGEPESATASLKGWLATGSPPSGGRGALSPAALAAGGGIPGLERWRGRVILVTGAGGGVGRELSLALAAAGARVVAVSRRKGALEELQAAAADAGVPPMDFLPVVCDLGKEAEVVALPRIVAKRWPGSGIDAVVNNASAGRGAPAAAGAGADGAAAGGAAAGGGSLMGGSTAAWVEAVSTNVLGTALATREAVQDMRRRGAWGHVVHVCCADAGAGGGGGGGGGGGMYAATTAAVRAMGEGLRAEAAAAGVPLRVSCVCPGAVGGAGGLAPGDVAAAVAWCLAAPAHVDVSEVVVRAAVGAGGPDLKG
jgi:guanylate kinase